MLNGTDNTVGTARTYDITGAHIFETITTYSKPPNGPYEEIHVLALLTIPSPNVSFYGNYYGTTVTPICNGAASTFNFTLNFVLRMRPSLERSFICYILPMLRLLAYSWAAKTSRLVLLF